MIRLLRLALSFLCLCVFPDLSFLDEVLFVCSLCPFLCLLWMLWLWLFVCLFVIGVVVVVLVVVLVFGVAAAVDEML